MAPIQNGTLAGLWQSDLCGVKPNDHVVALVTIGASSGVCELKEARWTTLLILVQHVYVSCHGHSADSVADSVKTVRGCHALAIAGVSCNLLKNQHLP